MTDKAPGWWRTYEVSQLSGEGETNTYTAPDHHAAAEWHLEDTWNGETGDFTVNVRDVKTGDEFEVTVCVEPSFKSRN